MKMVEQYLYAVSRYLPEKNRKDVTSELRANIEDMLPEHYTEEDAREVLTHLGSPRELAYQYDLNKRWLIGPGYYDQYLTVLKLVVGIAAAVLGAIVIISWIMDPSIAVENVEDGVSAAAGFLGALLGSVFSGMVQAAFWVTVIFVILERSGVALSESDGTAEWSPDDLKDIPSPKAEISRGGIVVSMLFAVLFLALLWFRPGIIAIFRTTEEGLIWRPLLNVERLRAYLPLVAGITIFEIGLLSWQYVSGRWTRSLALANTGYNGLVIIASSIMLRDASLFNQEFVREFGEIFRMGYETSLANMERVLLVLLVAIILLSIWDSIEGFRKAKRA